MSEVGESVNIVDKGKLVGFGRVQSFVTDDRTEAGERVIAVVQSYCGLKTWRVPVKWLRARATTQKGKVGRR